MIPLSTDDFAGFFREVHGYPPFPWQTRLLQSVAETGRWPGILDLPTGSGKTAAIDVALFHLALHADQGPSRKAPVRIAFVVDRRLVVDDAFERAKALERSLEESKEGSLVHRVADRLRSLSGTARALVARRLRGGVPREDDWARTPSQPTVLCSTVDQVGSRLLFRGYGVSDRMKPLHAGLLGSDCLIILDEAHLAEPFRQTLEWTATYRSEKWRHPEQGHSTPWGVSLLTATPGMESKGRFSLEAQDLVNETLSRRIQASKPARMIQASKTKEKPKEIAPASPLRDSERIHGLVEEALHAFADLVKKPGLEHPAIGIVVNRVHRARAVFDSLKKRLPPGAPEPILLIGPSRPVDRDQIVQAISPIRTRTWAHGETGRLPAPLFLVATQCIEAGVDIDLDGLITEAAPLDALRQRFGRLNRSGRDFEPYAAIVVGKEDLALRNEDPVYAKSILPAWKHLESLATKRNGIPLVDFGLEILGKSLERSPAPPEAMSPKEDAPILLPAHLDLLGQTSPVPATDPEVALYLHGGNRQPDAILVVWRADLDPDFKDEEAIRKLLLLAPPRTTEGIQLPIWAVKRWLQGAKTSTDALADIATGDPEEDEERTPSRMRSRQAFRWSGDDEDSKWITPERLRAGDTLVVPTTYGGLDAFGWNPEAATNGDPVAPTTDVFDKAALPYAGSRFVVRLAPGLIPEGKEGKLSDLLASISSRRWQDYRDGLLNLGLAEDLQSSLRALDRAKGKGNRVQVHLDLYGEDPEGRPKGIVLVAPFGIAGTQASDHPPDITTEDDGSGSLPGFALSLEEHSADVERTAGRFARQSGLPSDRVEDLKLAGYLHDAGKSDPRFQAWLHHGDPFGPDPADATQILAKSARPLPKSARKASGLPANWRHEAYSVRLALSLPRFAEAKDPELVVWLIGTHHGFGRPFFPHADPQDEMIRTLPPVLGLPHSLAPSAGPQSLAFDWNGLDWSMLHERLKERYGLWELARMEAILRLADHRASEEAARRTMGNEEEA